MKYSFIVPIYNDGELADDFCLEYNRVFQEYLGVQDISNEVELIFVNDGSRNNSMEYLVQATQKHAFVKAVELSRNFGQHIALSCGYTYATGQYVGMLNVDMEDPPAEIPKLLNHIQQHDVDMVFGTRQHREGALSVRVTSYLFHSFLNKLTGYNVPPNIATLRVMNRKFVDAYNALHEKSRYLPGLEMWLGFKKGYVNIAHKLRQRGKSSYNFRRRLLMAIESILSFSDLPLRLIALFGVLMALSGFFMTAFIILSNLLGIEFQRGYTSTVSIIIFMGGIQILVIGTASLYIGRILKEVQNRPLYIVRNTYKFENYE